MKTLGRFRPPAITTAERDAIPQAGLLHGMVIYNTTTESLQMNKAADAAVANWAEVYPAPPAATRIVRGLVNAGATLLSGTGFTVSRDSGTGTYLITFTVAFAAAPVVVASTLGDAGQQAGTVCDITAIAAGSFRAIIRMSSGTVDVNWSFIAVEI